VSPWRSWRIARPDTAGRGGNMALEEHISVIAEDCIGCELCVELCPATPTVFEMKEITAYAVHPEACEYCMLCIDNCPTDAIKMTRTEDQVFGPEDLA